QAPPTLTTPEETRTPRSAHWLRRKEPRRSPARPRWPSARVPVAEAAVDVACDPLLEDRPIEPLGARAEGLRLEAVGIRLEPADRRRQRLGGLRVEEEPGRGLVSAVERHDRLERAAVAEGDHGPSGRHRLERRDAEVRGGRKQQRATPRVELRDLGVAPPAEELDRRPRERAEPRLLRSRAHDDEANAE